MRRDRLLDDAFSALRGCGSSIKGKLQVSFVSLGVLEPGIDSGGLVKEFLEEASPERGSGCYAAPLFALSSSTRSDISELCKKSFNDTQGQI